MSSTIQQILLAAVPMLMALTIHEVSHGLAANYFGDDTAKRMGRLTLNPLKHLDPVGTLVFVLTRMIGWAKPVPVNFHKLRNPKQDMVWVALAGPAANLILAAVSAQLLHFFWSGPGGAVLSLKVRFFLLIVFKISVQINIALAVFNLIPILPLDGGRVLTGLLPVKYALKYAQLEKYGMLIIILFVMTDSFDRFFVPIIVGLYRIFVGI